MPSTTNWFAFMAVTAMVAAPGDGLPKTPPTVCRMACTRVNTDAMRRYVELFMICSYTLQFAYHEASNPCQYKSFMLQAPRPFWLPRYVLPFPQLAFRAPGPRRFSMNG